jgi:hypothetical protein
MSFVKKRGAVVLVALLMLLGLMFVLQISFYSSLYWKDIAVQRTIYMQRYRITQLMIHEGINRVIRGSIIDKEWYKKYKDWPLKNLEGVDGQLSVNTNSKGYSIEATLAHKSKMIMQLCCCLEKQVNSRDWTISNYRFKS